MTAKPVGGCRPYGSGAPLADNLIPLDAALSNVSHVTVPPFRNAEGAYCIVREQTPAGLHRLGSGGDAPAPPEPLIIRTDALGLGVDVERFCFFNRKVNQDWVPSRLNDVTCRAYMDYAHSSLPCVTGVVSMPFVHGNREIVAASGLRRDLRLIFHIEPSVVAIIPDPAIVTFEAAQASYQWLLDNLLFDVSTDADGKAILVAYALTLIQRHMLPEITFRILDLMSVAFVLGVGLLVITIGTLSVPDPETLPTTQIEGEVAFRAYCECHAAILDGGRVPQFNRITQICHFLASRICYSITHLHREGPNMPKRRHLPTVEGLNQNDAARLAGIHVDTFRKLQSDPFPPPKNESGYYELEQLGQWMRDKAEPDEKNDTCVKLDPTQERARKDREMADKYELENRVRRGELIEVATVHAAAMTVVMRVRSRMLRLPASVAPLVVGEEDCVTVQSVLDDAVRDALSELSGNWTGSEGG